MAGPRTFLTKDERLVLEATAGAAKTWNELRASTKLHRPKLQGALHRLTRSYFPPYVNRISSGKHAKYQASIEGRHYMGVPEIPTPTKTLKANGATNTLDFSSVPGVRGKLLRTLASVPMTAKNLALALGLPAASVITVCCDLEKQGLLVRREQPRKRGQLGKVPALYCLGDDRLLRQLIGDDTKKTTPLALVPSPELGEWIKGLMREVIEEHFATQQVRQEVVSIDLQPIEIKTEPAPPPPPSPERMRLPRILVVGTDATMEQRLLKDFKNCLDLRFWNSFVDSSAIVDKARSAAHVFLCSGRIRTHHQEALRASHIKFTLVSGGLSSLKRELTNYYFRAIGDLSPGVVNKQTEVPQ